MRSSRFTAGASQRHPLLRNNWRSGKLFGPGDYGDSMDDAKEVGTLRRSKNYDYSGDVGGDDLDYFEFKLDQRSPFSVKLRHEEDRGEPIAISILNKKGQVVKRDGKFLFANVEAGETETLSTSRLGKGNFYLRIQSEEGDNEDYEVDFSLNTSLSSGDDDNDLGSGKNLGTLTSGQSYTYDDKVGGSDIDFYQFNLQQTSRISALLSSPFSNTESIAFSILDSQKQTVRTNSGRFLFDNLEPGESSTLFAPTLAAGSYYVRVQSDVGRNLDYKLRLRRSAASVTPLA